MSGRAWRIARIGVRSATLSSSPRMVRRIRSLVWMKNGRQWQCGKDTANILADFINNRSVTCEDLGRDRYKRIIGRCTVAGEDIGSWMVQQGLALAYRRYSLDYVEEEADAQAVRRGVWAGEFVKPWEWRRGKRLDTGD